MRKRILSFFTLVCFVLAVLLLARVFSGRLILPQSFSIGPVTIHYYGIIMALAVACAFWLAIKRAEVYQLGLKQAEDFLFWIVIAGFVGARIYHVISHFSYYAIYPSEVIKVWNGGLSIYGAILGGLIALLIYQSLVLRGERGEMGIMGLLDWLTPSLILGQIIGRFGNMFNYEAFGYPTNLPWKFFVPIQFRPEDYQQFQFFHPFFLYEALGNLLILLILLKLSVVHKSASAKATADFTAASKPSNFKIFASGGSLFFSYLLLYNMLRFGLEFIRLDSTMIGGIRLNAVVALVFASVAAGYLIYRKTNVKTP